MSYHIGPVFIGVGPLLGTFPSGVNAGVFTASGISMALDSRVRLGFGIQVPILLGTPRAISFVTGLGITYLF